MLLMNLKGITVHVRQPRVGRAFEQLGLRGGAAAGGLRVHLILNAFCQLLDFELPATGDGGVWRRWIDTAVELPEDIVPWPTPPVWPGGTYGAAAHSYSATSGEGKLVSRLVSHRRLGHLPLSVPRDMLDDAPTEPGVQAGCSTAWPGSGAGSER
jgi:hypothetical protein